MTVDDDISAVRDHLSAANPVPLGMGPGEAVEPPADPRLFGAADAERPRRSGVRVAFVSTVGATAAALILAMVLTGSDGSPKGTVTLSGSGAKVISASYQTTKEAGTARASFVIDVAGMTLSGEGVGDLDQGLAEGSLLLGEGQDRIEVVAAADGFYARLPQHLGMATGKPWVKVDRSVLTELVGIGLGPLGSSLSAAPFDVLGYLQGVSGEVRIVGPDTVWGSETTRYTASIDLGRVAEELSGVARDSAQHAASALGEPVPADLWVDGEGRLRKLTVTVDLAKVDGAPSSRNTASAVGADGTATATFELYDFGTDIDVSPPPADQVSDVGALLNGFLGRR